MNRCLLILITSLILLFCYESKKPNVYKVPIFLINHKQIVDKYFNNPKLAAVLFSYTTGIKTDVSRSIINAHKNLYLIHLFTPSGLHLSSLFIFLTPFLSLLKFKSFNYFFWASLFLTIPPFFLDGFWAVKRISFLRLLWIVFKRTPLKISLFWVFLISFVLDFLFGTFQESPLSFTYSFLFLGMIFANQKWPAVWLPLFLMLGQFIVCFTQEIPFFPLNFFFGFFMTSLFTLLFPILFLGVLIPQVPYFAKIFLSLFLFLVETGSKILKNSPSFFISIDLLFLVFILISSFDLKKKGIFIILFSIFHSLPLKNLRDPRQGNDFYLANEKKNIEKVITTEKGYKILYKEGWTCYYNFSNFGLKKNCQ